MKKLVDRIFGRIAALILTVIIFAVLIPLLILAAIFAPGPLGEAQTLVIPHGANIRNVAALLDADGVIYSKYAFRLGSKLLTADILKAGEYQFEPHQSAASILTMMHNGQSIVHMLTIAEGLTSAEIVAGMQGNNLLTGDIQSVPPEGSLLPETYRYSFGDSRAGLIARMQKSMQDATAAIWAARDPGLPVNTLEQALIMASIVEKETAKAEERPRVAGVFYNRLAQNMRLQSDPTTIYALTQGRGPLSRELTHDDLAVASPYNTYASDGLPPHPICNPGRASLTAATHPEHNNFLYFVADGSGGHAFSHDLAQHNRNVTRWIQVKIHAPVANPATPAPPPASH